MRVVAVIPVVTENHDLTVRNDARSPVILWRLFDEGLVTDFSVDDENSASNKNCFATACNDALDESIAFLVAAVEQCLWWLEDDDIFIMWQAGESRHFVNKKLVTHFECRIHG